MSPSRRFVLAAVLLLAACSQEAPTPTISAQMVLADPPAGALILDVRTPQEFAGGHVPGAVNVPHSEVAARLHELAAYREAPVVVYCESGGRAAQAEAALRAAGFDDVRHLAGDMRAWRAARLPVAR